ncbi:TonB-dependent receptor [Sphingomonas sp. AP4-R1]|uniref:TonB-dependent receptor domain-containing protein n=1 Tax=Sphingomonas sp. AP4-R1 TaxID=2735134 RepID=UPI00149397C4|nr:TonB-dependent receptor [Sphingomonas sp. AP4-R1]QJU58331.1 TonB-dependent receptor [Sphingomonas sp. AP4-R1]
MTTAIGPRRNNIAKAGLMLAAAWLAIATPSWAQTASVSDPLPSAGTSADEGELVVTGSQVSRSGFTTPTPTTVIGSAELARIAAPTVADALNQLPALRGSLTPTSNTSNSVTIGGNYLDLRGLGNLRTLTLIDGKRYVPTTTTGSVNINVIPQALISTADVVTGGASAAYGSDAVAGVVNLRFDNNLKGLKATGQAGISDHNDHRNFLISLGYGGEFGNGRGKLLLGGELQQNKGVGALNSRKWGNAGTIQNPAYTATNGQPQLLLVNDVRASNATYAGMISAPASLRGTQFTSSGTGTIPFAYGANATATTMDGGDGYPLNGVSVLESPVKRWNGFGRATYNLFADITASAEFNYARTDVNSDSNLRVDSITIRRDNAYLPASLVAQMAANNISSFTMGRGFDDYARGLFDITTKSWQAAGGLKGKIGGSWSFDSYFAHGKTRSLTLFTDDRITTRWQQSIDAVVNPANGQIVCRSTLSSPTNGCVPANFFGVGNVSEAAKTWMNGTSVRDWNIGQTVASLTLRGEPISLWAGPISFATGGEYRRQTVRVTSDPLSVTNSFRIGNNQPWSARQNVKEAFVEIVVPLAKDESWAQNIDLDIAGRITDYSTSGTVKTWKAGLNYTVNDSIRLRATRSRDIRAPSMDELFSAGGVTLPSINDPLLRTTYNVQQLATGNPDLKPEKADTFTGGIVVQPSFVPRLRLSVDYYEIKLKGAINTLTTSQIVQRCYTDTPQLCALITRPSATANITVVRAAPANLQRLETSGIDFELAYAVPVGPGRINFRSLVNYTNKLDLIDGAATRHFAGNTETIGIGGVPHWRFNTNLGYETSRVNINLTGRYVGGGILTQDNNIDVKRVSGRLYLDLSGEWTIIDHSSNRVALFGKIQNLGDKDPPLTQTGTARALYDVLGRIYTAGIRVTY